MSKLDGCGSLPVIPALSKQRNRDRDSRASWLDTLARSATTILSQRLCLRKESTCTHMNYTTCNIHNIPKKSNYFNKEIKDHYERCTYGTGWSHVITCVWIYKERGSFEYLPGGTLLLTQQEGSLRSSHSGHKPECAEKHLPRDRSSLSLNWLQKIKSNRVQSIRRPLQSDVPKVIPRPSMMYISYMKIFSTIGKVPIKRKSFHEESSS